MIVSAAGTGLSILGGAAAAAAVTAAGQVILARYTKRQSDAQADLNEANADRVHVGTANDVIEMLRIEVARLGEQVKELRAENLDCQRGYRELERSYGALEHRSDAQERRIEALEDFIEAAGLVPPPGTLAG